MSIIHTRGSAFMALATLLLLFVCGSAFGAGPGGGNGDQADTLNTIDQHGKKQGYWIVKGKDKPTVPRFKETQKIEEGNYSASRKNGLWKRYFPNQNNTLHTKINYRIGRPTGDYVIFYPDGKIEEKGRWVRNRQIGRFERYYKDGTPQQLFNYNENGKRQGEQIYYHPNGEVAIKVKLENGRKEGLMERFWPDGTIKERMVFHEGKLDANSIEDFPAPAAFKDKEINFEPISDVKPPKIEESKEKSWVGSINCNGRNKLMNRAGQVTKEGLFKNCRLYDGKVYNYQDGILIDIDIYKKGFLVGKGVAETKDQ